jgi:DNA-binding winged helix-turn-helix (wHTH) protein
MLANFTEGLANPGVPVPRGTQVTIGIDLAEERVWKDGAEVRLRRKAFAILKRLARSPRRIVTRAEIIEAVWGKIAMSESLLRTHVRDLRQVIGDGVVETVVARGYRVVADIVYVGSTTDVGSAPVFANADVRAVVAEPSAESLGPLLARFLLEPPNHRARCGSARVVLHPASSNEVRRLLGLDDDESDAPPLLLVVCLGG